MFDWQVVLFDIGSVYHKLAKWKSDFWNVSHIGIPDPDTESNDAVVFGYLVAQFASEVKKIFVIFQWLVQQFPGLFLAGLRTKLKVLIGVIDK